MWWWSGPWMFFAPLMFLLCLGMMFFMMRGCMPHRDANQKRALEILEERFAKGEIDQGEFEQRRRALTA
jgi:uncharacterized membrane protein